jgi:hypothetical protein
VVIISKDLLEPTANWGATFSVKSSTGEYAEIYTNTSVNQQAGFFSRHGKFIEFSAVVRVEKLFWK